MAPSGDGTFPAYQVPAPKADFELVQRPLEAPPPGHVRVKVHACGVCHGDCIPKLGIMFPTKYPKSPGHEVAGEVDARGDGVEQWSIGDRVGVGWYGGCCNECEDCREGDLVLCHNAPITGITVEGGYSQYITVKANALAKIPDQLSFLEAAPLMCAGVTVYNGLRRTKTTAGATVGVQGIGGLGHMAIQYANKMGYRVFAFSRGTDKKDESLKLGAHEYFDTTEEGFVEKVQAKGGVKVLIATSTSAEAMTSALPTLAKNGTFLVLGADSANISVNPGFMIGGRRRIMGSPSGTAAESEDAMKFAALTGIRSVSEVFPIKEAPAAYERTMSFEAKFRVVLDWDS